MVHTKVREHDLAIRGSNQKSRRRVKKKVRKIFDTTPICSPIPFGKLLNRFVGGALLGSGAHYVMFCAFTPTFDADANGDEGHDSTFRHKTIA